MTRKWRNIYTTPIGPDTPNRWEILNSNILRWGTESYASQADAESELRSFWRGVSGVDMKKFSIRPIEMLWLRSELDLVTEAKVARCVASDAESGDELQSRAA